MSRQPVLFGAATLAVALLASAPIAAAPGANGHTHASFAAGVPGNAKRPFRVIEVSIQDENGNMRYVPGEIQVRTGEQIKFVLRNDGVLDHEFILDSFEGNAKHKEEMEKNPEMEHDDPNAKRLAPKKGAEILWRFTKPGRFEFACLIPGHYDAGMKGVVVVENAPGPAPAAKKTRTNAK